jgi:16S rRNA (guanine1516-N2)-methyltransferase
VRKRLKAVGFTVPECQEKAYLLAKMFKIPLGLDEFPRLEVTVDKIMLLLKGFKPLFVDFTSTSLSRRHAVGKQQGLVRACMIKPSVRILDATAGWGRDAAILASFGARVMMLERDPVMAVLLQDGLLRLHHSTMDLTLLSQDAKIYLSTLEIEEYPDVIYIDPMHPVRQKSALVKKDLQALQQLIGADDDVLALIELARSRTLDRVVVKWPERLPPLLKPTFSYHGKTIRFDVYC